MKKPQPCALCSHIKSAHRARMVNKIWIVAECMEVPVIDGELQECGCTEYVA